MNTTWSGFLPPPNHVPIPNIPDIPEIPVLNENLQSSPQQFYGQFNGQYFEQNIHTTMQSTGFPTSQSMPSFSSGWSQPMNGWAHSNHAPPSAPIPFPAPQPTSDHEKKPPKPKGRKKLAGVPSIRPRITATQKYELEKNVFKESHFHMRRRDAIEMIYQVSRGMENPPEKYQIENIYDRLKSRYLKTMRNQNK